MPLATARTDRSLPGRVFHGGRTTARSHRDTSSAQGEVSSEQVGRRRPALAAGGALTVVLCGALGAVVSARAPQRMAFLAVAQTVPAGATVAASDLESISITPAAGLEAIPLQEAGQVVGRRAAEALEPGSLLVRSELASGLALAAGRALVGSSLAVDQMPAGLAAGQRVLVVLSGTGGSGLGTTSGLQTGSGLDEGSGAAGGTIAGPVPSPTGPPGSVLTDATVLSVLPASASSGTAGSGSSDLTVTLDVPVAAAAAVTAASASGDVSLAALGGPDGSPRADGSNSAADPPGPR